MRIVQQYNSSTRASNTQYGKYCKYQLLRYKPWSTNFADCLGNDNVEDEELWINAWKDFFASDLGRAKVPDWSIAMENLDEQLKNSSPNQGGDSSEDDLKENRDSRYNHQDQYMGTMPDAGNEIEQEEPDSSPNGSIEYWSAGRKFLTDDPN